jgi:hypothetical protein
VSVCLFVCLSVCLFVCITHITHSLTHAAHATPRRGTSLTIALALWRTRLSVCSSGDLVFFASQSLERRRVDMYSAVSNTWTEWPLLFPSATTIVLSVVGRKVIAIGTSVPGRIEYDVDAGSWGSYSAGGVSVARRYATVCTVGSKIVVGGMCFAIAAASLLRRCCVAAASRSM